MTIALSQTNQNKTTQECNTTLAAARAARFFEADTAALGREGEIANGLEHSSSQNLGLAYWPVWRKLIDRLESAVVGGLEKSSVCCQSLPVSSCSSCLAYMLLLADM
jgi:hypothetical protein